MKHYFLFYLISICTVIVLSPKLTYADSPTPTPMPIECVACPENNFFVPGKGCCTLDTTVSTWSTCQPEDKYRTNCVANQYCIPGMGCQDEDTSVPSLSANECIVCPKDTYFLPKKGCCKLELSSSADWLKCEPAGTYKAQCRSDQSCVPNVGCRDTVNTPSLTGSRLCAALPPSEQPSCQRCMGASGKEQGVWTSLGCMPVDISLLLSTYIMGIAVSIGGGLSFITFIFGSFLILTSNGETERITKGKKYIISSLKGILLIIFALLIIKIVGVDILQIPGFG